MNKNELIEQLIRDEGKVNKIYLDSEGYPTFGIGHMIKKDDPEYGKPIGTPVSEKRVMSVFESDVNQTIDDCKKLYPDFHTLPEEAQLIIANMMFNLGLTKLSKFVNMKKAVDNERWYRAAEEMKDSLWYNQVGNRSRRLVARMRNLADFLRKKEAIIN